MTPGCCPRHPNALAQRGHCPACLLEHAIGSGVTADASPPARFTIEVPLGRSPHSAVFLVRGEWPWRRLLRLKQWSFPAPAAFLDGFAHLRSHLESFAHPAIVMPVTAWLEPEGTASALTEFRQGMPLLDAVRRGRLSGSAAVSSLRKLRSVMGAAHEAGLVHGSIGAGNVFVTPSGDAPFLLDFGWTPLLSATRADPTGPPADVLALEVLESAVAGS